MGARACYLLCRLVKVVHSSLHPLVAELLTALQPHLDRIATSPHPEPPSVTKSPSGGRPASLPIRDGSARRAFQFWGRDKGSRVRCAGISSTTDDRLYAHEAAGILVGGEELPEQQQLACLQVLMQPLLAQIERNLPSVRAATRNANGPAAGDETDLAAGLVLQVRSLGRPVGPQKCSVQNGSSVAPSRYCRHWRA